LINACFPSKRTARLSGYSRHDLARFDRLSQRIWHGSFDWKLPIARRAFPGLAIAMCGCSRHFS
jgi:hypothetical protein